MKAIVNRELPEATRQVKEIQDLILVSAQEMLTLTETLENLHLRLEEALAEAVAEQHHFQEILGPVKDQLHQAQKVVTGLYEKMSFQDLAGQRLAKVENFCGALARIFEASSAAGRAGDARPEKPAWTARDKTSAWEKKPRAAASRRTVETDTGSRPPRPGHDDAAAAQRPSGALKGPQAEGDGLDQSDIDSLLSGS